MAVAIEVTPLKMDILVDVVAVLLQITHLLILVDRQIKHLVQMQ